MEIGNRDEALQIKAFAKVNLFLEILARRPDGYHEIDSVFQEVDLADDLTLTDQPAELTLTCSNPAIETEHNLAYLAARMLREVTGTRRGVHIEIQKNIPTGAGLGGGSSDAAATLAGLNRLWDLGLDRPQLVEIGQAIGSDVPFFLYGGTARVQGRGETVTPQVSAKPCYLVILFPDFSIPTEQVYKNLKLDLTSERRDGISMLHALSQGQVSEVGLLMFNRLQPVALDLHPALQNHLHTFAQCKSNGVLMSGTGSSIFALHDSREAAQETYERVCGTDGDAHFYIVESTKHGAV